MVENLKLDRNGGKPRGLQAYGIEALGSLLSDYSLIDIWREIHPNKKEFSRHSRYDNISNRLDRIYLNSAWALNVSSVYIHPYNLPQQTRRGRGIWKMNLSHIEDEAYIKRIAIVFSINKQTELFFMFLISQGRYNPRRTNLL